MKRQWAWIAGLALLAGWTQAQEACHWMNVSQRYYRVVGTDGSQIDSILLASGAFVVSNAALGGEIVAEAALDMIHSNWISQEHLRVDAVGTYQMVEATDPACIPRTGQRWTYHDGDDGDLQPGHGWPPRFTVPEGNTNVVVDNLTGLMWSRLASPIYGSWDNCLNLMSILEEGMYEYDGWRMPTVREMESLIDLGNFSPALPTLHPFNNLAEHYWTSTGDVTDTNQAWKVSIVDGSIHSWDRTNDVPYCWPVRSHTIGKAPVPKTGMTTSLRTGDDGDLRPGQPWPVPRFTVMADTNLVFDNLVGRIWTRRIGIGATTSWGTAVDHCNDLALGGYDDWRLPTRREAWSLIDFGRSDFLPAGHPFIGAPATPFWTSSSYGIESDDFAWGINGGLLSPVIKTFMGAEVWPVRGGW